MNSFNSIDKIKFEKNRDEIVNLNEYILFTDDELKEKYIVLKLRNNINQNLSEIKLEIKEYDENELLVEKLVISLDDFLAKGLEEFVPEAKIKVNYLCKTISCKLLYARFEGVYWENNEFKKIAYTFNEYKDSKFEKPKTLEEKVIEKEKKKKQKATFLVIDVSKKNKTIFPLIYRIIVTLLAIGGLITLSIYLKTQTKALSDESFNYTLIGDKSLKITGLNTDKRDLTINDNYEGYKITEIDTNAFYNSKIESINILNENIIIKEHAFKDSKNLKSISGSVKKIEQFAFSGCVSLTNVELTKCQEIEQFAFIKCEKIKYFSAIDTNLDASILSDCKLVEELKFKDTDCNYIGQIFNTSNFELKLKKLTILKSKLEKEFLYSINLEEITILSSIKFEGSIYEYVGYRCIVKYI